MTIIINQFHWITDFTFYVRMWVYHSHHPKNKNTGNPMTPGLVYFFTPFPKPIYVLWPLALCMARIQERLLIKSSLWWCAYSRWNPKFGLSNLGNGLLTSRISEGALWISPKNTFLKSGQSTEKTSESSAFWSNFENYQFLTLGPRGQPESVKNL